FALDPDTADRLLSDALEPEGVPHRYGEVALLLRLASGPTDGARFGEEAAVATVVGAIRPSHRPAAARRPGPHARLTVATAGGQPAGRKRGPNPRIDETDHRPAVEPDPELASAEGDRQRAGGRARANVDVDAPDAGSAGEEPQRRDPGRTHAAPPAPAAPGPP